MVRKKPLSQSPVTAVTEDSKTDHNHELLHSEWRNRMLFLNIAGCRTGTCKDWFENK